jgi:hypothetical protein
MRSSKSSISETPAFSLTDYAPMHRIDGVDYWKPMPYKAHEPRRRAQAGPGPFGTLRADGDDGETWS